MTNTNTLTEKAVAGRRVEFTYHRDRGLPNPPTYPGVITGTEPGASGRLLARVRLDGTRSNLHIPVDYEGLTYLDEVGPVPELPMGRFTPVASDPYGFYKKAGVLLATIGEDGADLVVITDDPEIARAAARLYDTEIGVDVDSVNYGAMAPKWAVFEWEPEDAECPWTVSWASQGDDQAVHIYYLPS
ncbi:hypothetical protein OIA45_48775 (plasmid) [Streptomyces chartreusis]|uniref:hypothetical protein n=1 Tax=Streptomyces chartreusis TaxID=1969 RepID=UPI0037DC12DE|nr:hypothetical protein OIA45_48775 [Streptomyces chartreusis]